MRQWFEMVALSSCLKSLQLHASKAQPCNQSHLPDHFVPWHHKSSYLAQEKNKWRWWELSSYPSGYCCEISSCFKLRPVLCLLCEILMAVLLPPSAGCDAGASMSPSPAQAGHCVYLLLWVGSRLRGALRRVFPCVFPAPSNTSEILGSCCGCCISSSHKVVFAACAFPCSGFVYQILNISFLRFCYRHVFQRAFSFIFLNFHCLASRPLGQKGSRIFFCGVDDRKLHLLEKQVVQMWFCQLYAV